MAIRKVPKLPKYMDIAHRTVVCACIGMTLYGTYLLGQRFYRYFTVIKPDREIEERKMMEELDKMDMSAFVDPAPKLSN